MAFNRYLTSMVMERLISPDRAIIHQIRQIAVLSGNGDGSFQSPVTFAAGTNASVAVVADLNGDKAPDVIATVPSDNAVAVLLNATGSDFSISASSVTPNSLSPGRERHFHHLAEFAKRIQHPRFARLLRAARASLSADLLFELAFGSL